MVKTMAAFVCLNAKFGKPLAKKISACILSSLSEAG